MFFPRNGRSMSELKKLLQAMNEGDMSNSDRACTWTEDTEGVWQTECGRCFQINEGSPAENGMLFCYHCGRRLLVHQWEDAEDGE